MGFLWLLNVYSMGKCWWEVCQISFSLESIKPLSSERDFLATAIQLALREKRAIKFRRQQCQLNARGKDLPTCQFWAISPCCHISGLTRSGHCFCLSLLGKVSLTLADGRVLLLSDAAVLAGNWLSQAWGEIWSSAPISCLYAQGAGRGFLLGMISILSPTAKEQRTLQSSNLSLPCTPTSLRQEHFSSCPGAAKFALADITE